MATASMPVVGGKPYRLPFIIGASSAGTLIEWYDFYLYGSLAVFFSTQFFPPGNPTAALLVSLAIFATGFIVRTFTFLATLILMGLATTLVGFLPTYAQIGLAAPILLVLLRLIQGLALGGEYGGAAIYIAEHAPDNRRGYLTSYIQTTATLGILLSLLVILAFRLTMGDAAFKEYGWRFPFLLSAVLVVLSIYIRMKLLESPLFERLREEGKNTSK